MSLAALIRSMADAGAPPEAIALAVEAIEAMQSKEEDRKRRDRERKRKVHGNSAEIPVVSEEAPGKSEGPPLMVSPTPPSLKPYNPPSPPTGAQTPTGVQPRKRASRLDPNSKPTETNIADAKKLGLTDDHIAREWPKYVDYFSAAPGQKGLKTDWPATWRNWCRRVAETLGLSPPSEAGSAAPGFIIVKPDQPEWEPLARRWRAERNRADGPPLGPSGGWTFPRDWLDSQQAA